MSFHVSNETKLNSRASTYDKIRNYVHAGKFHPGEPLRLESLSEMVNASATPIREALFRLCAEGLVERSNRGFKAPMIRTHMMTERLSHLLIIIGRCLDEHPQLTENSQSIIETTNFSFVDPETASANFEHQLECLVNDVIGEYWAGIVRLLCAQTHSIRRIDFEQANVQQQFAPALISAEISEKTDPRLFHEATAALKERADSLVREYIARTINGVQSHDDAPRRMIYRG